MPEEWKSIRITKEAWREAKKVIAGEGIDLDDFLSFIIESTDLGQALSDYIKALEEQDQETETNGGALDPSKYRDVKGAKYQGWELGWY